MGAAAFAGSVPPVGARARPLAVPPPTSASLAIAGRNVFVVLAVLVFKRTHSDSGTLRVINVRQLVFRHYEAVQEDGVKLHSRVL